METSTDKRILRLERIVLLLNHPDGEGVLDQLLEAVARDIAQRSQPADVQARYTDSPPNAP